ncbi:hypothetical protein NLI96_g6340 [Meripilus lineatus]|uniref:protein S-acyltransferase n=1 Tax=Meripilus lineatus TaxID=2056292 RepID=A0AAD5V609_9APHY|nr:hypothetical protein NLI96_g6340 [Physisporinus lineatus]
MGAEHPGTSNPVASSSGDFNPIGEKPKAPGLFRRVSFCTSFIQRLLKTPDPQLTIFEASQRGNLRRVHRLISSGQAHATDIDDGGVPCLHWAAINGHVDICRYLIENGADVQSQATDLLATPLQWAALQGRLPVIQLMLERGADLDYQDRQGFTTLHHAVISSSSPSSIDYLSDRCTPAQIDIQDFSGYTPLLWAIAYKDALSIEMLLERGASVETIDHNSFTAMDWALDRGLRATIRMLLERGADVIPDHYLIDRTGTYERAQIARCFERGGRNGIKHMGAWRLAVEEIESTITRDFQTEKQGSWENPADQSIGDRSCQGHEGSSLARSVSKKRAAPVQLLLDVDGEDNPPPPYKDKVSSSLGKPSTQYAHYYIIWHSTPIQVGGEGLVAGMPPSYTGYDR